VENDLLLQREEVVERGAAILLAIVRKKGALGI